MFASGNSQGESSLLSREATVVYGEVDVNDRFKAVLTFARVGICQRCVTIVVLPLWG